MAHGVEGDLGRSLAEVAEEAVVEGPDPVLGRDEHARREEEVDRRRDGDDRAPAPVAPHEDDETEHRDRQREVLLANDGENRGEREPSPSLVARGPVREEQRPDRDRVGVEELPREPLVRRVEEQRRRQRDAGPFRPQQVAREQEDRDRAARLGQDLHDEQEDRSRAQPIERHEQQQEDVRVMAEELEPTNRHERVLGAREQPSALVVDAEVEAERAEAVVAQHR